MGSVKGQDSGLREKNTLSQGTRQQMKRQEGRHSSSSHITAQQGKTISLAHSRYKARSWPRCKRAGTVCGPTETLLEQSINGVPCGAFEASTQPSRGDKRLQRDVYTTDQDPTMRKHSNSSISARQNQAIQELTAAPTRLSAVECDHEELDVLRSTLEALGDLMNNHDGKSLEWIEQSKEDQEFLDAMSQVCHGRKPTLRIAMIGARALLNEAVAGETHAPPHPLDDFADLAHPRSEGTAVLASVVAWFRNGATRSYDASSDHRVCESVRPGRQNPTWLPPQALWRDQRQTKGISVSIDPYAQSVGQDESDPSQAWLENLPLRK